MKVTMISNYINHHQIPFSDELYHRLGKDYHFIQTEPMEEERKQMGWQVEEEKIPYLVRLDQEEEYGKQLIEESDLLLIGWNNREELFSRRLSSDRLTIRISERIYREGQWKVVSPKGLIRKYKEHIRYRKGSVYLLCAGAYVSSDFSLIKAYPDKMMKFGYFPKFIPSTKEEREKNHPWGKVKGEKMLQLVWAGRFIPLKYPEHALEAAKVLKEKGYSFHLHLIGGGELEERLKQISSSYGVEKDVTFYGFLSPDEVRKIMEKSHIHLFTSNHLEGWGAVMNEAMNCGCVEVANVQIGAAPYLVTHKENGLLYEEGKVNDLISNIEYLFDHPEEGKRMGENAYKTIASHWNEKEAVSRLLTFYKEWKRGKIDLPEEGPFSKAEIISPGTKPEKLYR